ncbi:sodium:proton antiporter [Crassaminicella thermophila]|uniref:Sodium:proton antiporter n=1 Tax=Crassaminicella thermophila TaxID=2599308 RepID=A0A5C0SI42_CRATE|nr:Na+/H+ antiporter NhaC family protein [Crassaminicella thermophila]QEK13396.1 sodium:proton antiporter [Crassaminicella thermophila]
MKRAKRNISFKESVFLLFTFIFILMWGALKAKIPTGMSILLCAIVTSTYGMLILRFEWDEILKGILKVFSIGMPAVLILLMVGLITASWLASGTTPILIYWGLKILRPSIFLIAAFLITSIASIATGSAWAIIGTFGVALMGIANGIGVPIGVAVGAIVAGSYLGDKWSPLSDSANLAAAVAGQDVFHLFKSMFSTTGLGALGAIIIYGIIGLGYANNSAVDASSIKEIIDGLANAYNFNIILILPPLVVIYLAVRKKPILPVLVIGVIIGAILAILLQNIPVNKMLSVLYSGYSSSTGLEGIDKLLSGGGLKSMMGLILIIFCAFIFAGTVEVIGILDTILNKLTKLTQSEGSLVLTSLITSVLTVYLSSSVYVSLILNGRMYVPAYERVGLHKVNLSRTIVEAASYSGAYVPWSGGALLILGTLGLKWYEFAPYLFNHWISMVLVVLFAFMGKFMEKNSKYNDAAKRESDEPFI